MKSQQELIFCILVLTLSTYSIAAPKRMSEAELASETTIVSNITSNLAAHIQQDTTTTPHTQNVKQPQTSPQHLGSSPEQNQAFVTNLHKGEIKISSEQMNGKLANITSTTINSFVPGMTMQMENFKISGDATIQMNMR